MDRLRRIVGRFALIWLIEALSLAVMTALIPTISFTSTAFASDFVIALAAALVLGVVNVSVRPVLLYLTLPLNRLTVGASTLLINALTLMLTSWLLPQLRIADFGAAVLGAIVLTAVNTLFTSLFRVDEEDSFFQRVVESLSKRQRLSGTSEPGRGLVMLEIDGLSYERLKLAVDRGFMPTVRQLLSKDHTLALCECGLPSQTSACQAGILYGDNFDIPAFRWYEKERSRMIVSNHFADAAELNARFADGHGLLRGGSSINNLMAGDAEKTILTMSTLNTRDANAQRYRAEDMYLFWLHPYFFTRSLILSLADIVVELWQGLWQRVRNVQPRINRLAEGYPILRAITNVFLRDLSTYLVVLDVIRGVPAIYTTYVGYDEVAHHAGPDTLDALRTLRGLDRVIRRVRHTIEHKAPRSYDLIILSDHGQSFGATFKQRHGQSLAGFVNAQTAPEVNVAEVRVPRLGTGYAAALVAELQNVEDRKFGRRTGRAAMRGARRALERNLKRPEALSAAVTAPVVVCVSGNLANVYFNIERGKVNLNKLNEAYPGVVDALVGHRGIGFVVTYDDDGTPIVLGRGGARDLRTGIVTGTDPLLPFGDIDLRARQLLRLAEFPHAGDLIVNSAVDDNGQVAAFEELVGSHGGLGGQQTHAFMVHPRDMRLTPTTNSMDVFALLDGRRRAQLAEPEHVAPAALDVRSVEVES